MYQLSAHQLGEVDRLWRELSLLFPGDDPPETDDQLIAAGLDSLLAGVLSSEGRVGCSALVEWREEMSQCAKSHALASLLGQLETVLRANSSCTSTR